MLNKIVMNTNAKRHYANTLKEFNIILHNCLRHFPIESIVFFNETIYIIKMLLLNSHVFCGDHWNFL